MPLVETIKQNSKLIVKANEKKTFRLLIIPGHPKFGDLHEGWFHSITGPQTPSIPRGKFFGYEKCINQKQYDTACPFCTDRPRWPMTLRRACNVYCLDDNKIYILFQGPQVWDSIIQNIQTQAEGMGGQATPYIVASQIDLIMSRNTNNQYNVVSRVGQPNIIPQNILQDPDSHLFDISATEEFQTKTTDQLIYTMNQALHFVDAGQQGGLNGGQYAYGMTTGAPAVGAAAPPVTAPYPSVPVAPSMPATGAPASPGYVGPPQVGSWPTPPATPPVPPVTNPNFGAPVAPPASTFGVPENIAPPPTTTGGAPAQFDMTAPPPTTTSTPPSGGLQQMSIDEAKSIVCPYGKHMNKTLGQIADEDPAYLVGYLTSYYKGQQPGNLIYTACTIIGNAIASQTTADNQATMQDMGQDMGVPIDKYRIIGEALTQGKLASQNLMNLMQERYGKTQTNQLTEAELDDVIATFCLG